IQFEYNTYAGTTRTNNPVFIGGAVLSGGFFAAPNVQLMPGFQMTWIQTVQATVPGRNVWGAGANTTFPDSPDPADPSYPRAGEFILRTGQTLNQPSVAFQDPVPRFAMANSVSSWQAELGLVCENTTTHVADIVGTFTWGFILQAVAPANATIA